MKTTRRTVSLVALILLLGACARGPGEDEVPPDPASQPVPETAQTGGRGAMGSGMMGSGGMMGRDGMMSGPADTAAAPRARAVTASAPGCPDISQALTDAGRRVFTGGGNCYTCHGSDAHGSALAPNLTDTTWLDIGGSYAAIADLVRAGVPNPKQFPAPMPSMGGAELTDEQICAVSAYVLGLGG